MTDDKLSMFAILNIFAWIDDSIIDITNCTKAASWVLLLPKTAVILLDRSKKCKLRYSRLLTKMSYLSSCLKFRVNTGQNCPLFV